MRDLRVYRCCSKVLFADHHIANMAPTIPARIQSAAGEEQEGLEVKSGPQRRFHHGRNQANGNDSAEGYYRHIGAREQLLRASQTTATSDRRKAA